MTYESVGSVRGSCGHAHRTIKAAVACARADNARVKRGNGPSSYSDRFVRRTDGARLSEREADELHDAEATL